MPVLYLVGSAQHKLGVHRIHAPVLTPEGKPVKRSDVEEGVSLVRVVEFRDGKSADLDDVGLVKWLKEKGHAAEVYVEAYGLCQPGKGPVLAYDEGGNPEVVKEAEPAPLPGTVADEKKGAK